MKLVQSLLFILLVICALADAKGKRATVDTLNLKPGTPGDHVLNIVRSFTNSVLFVQCQLNCERRSGNFDIPIRVLFITWVYEPYLFCGVTSANGDAFTFLVWTLSFS